MALNVKKCGYVAPLESNERVYVGGEELPRLEEYTYLGFPMTDGGIDFTKHLRTRLDQACGRTSFLSLTPSPAHRLRIYRQYLASIFEYGAPLVAAYAERCSQIREGTKGAVKRLTGWISGCESNTHVTRNFLGLQPLPYRLASLKTLFQIIIRYCHDSSSLMVLRGLDWRPDSTFQTYLQSGRDASAGQETVKQWVRLYLRERRDDALSRDARRRKLTRLIPSSGRLKRDMRGADRILHAPRLYRKRFLQYRHGMFNAYKRCACTAATLFNRGHEACFRPGGRSWLTKRELRAKARLQAALGTELRLTEVDVLLNTGKFERANDILQHIKKF